MTNFEGGKSLLGVKLDNKKHVAGLIVKLR